MMIMDDHASFGRVDIGKPTPLRDSDSMGAVPSKMTAGRPDVPLFRFEFTREVEENVQPGLPLESTRREISSV